MVYLLSTKQPGFHLAKPMYMTYSIVCLDKYIFVYSIDAEITVSCIPYKSAHGGVCTAEARVWVIESPIRIGFVEPKTRVMPIPVAVIVLTSGHKSASTFC